ISFSNLKSSYNSIITPQIQLFTLNVQLNKLFILSICINIFIKKFFSCWKLNPSCVLPASVSSCLIAAGPIIDRDWLIELNEGLILLSGGRMGDVGRSLLRGN
ncbi:DNA polymerase III subunit alpha, partial [human gut metagenome]